MPIIKTEATYDDLIALPDNLIAEIVDGNLHGSPRSGLRQALARSVLGFVLGSALERTVGSPGGWWMLGRPEIHLSDDVLVPDLAGWRHEHLPEVPDVPWMSLAPDWLCEVVAPETERLDRVDKLRVYGRENVGHVWIVNPSTRTLEIFRRVASGWLLVGAHGGRGLIRAEPFDAIEWDLAALWGESSAMTG